MLQPEQACFFRNTSDAFLFDNFYTEQAGILNLVCICDGAQSKKTA